MKRILYYLIPICFALAMLVTSCDTDPEALDLTPDPSFVTQDGQTLKKDEAYWENIRRYKATMKERPITFGWFGNWTGLTGVSNGRALRGLPDSTDIVSIWSGSAINSEAKRADLKYAQEVMGMKVTFTFFWHNWNFGKGPWDEYTRADFDADPELADRVIREYAVAIKDSMNARGYDGIDMDQEASSGDIFYQKKYMSIFLDEFSKYAGPESGTDKLILVDGYINRLDPADWSKVDYGISQAYYSTGYTDLQNRYNQVAAGLPPHKFVVTEDFERAVGGTNSWVDEHGNVYRSGEGMARWNPTQGRKGGCGYYHMEYEADQYPAYYWLRKAINIMNPPVY